MTPLRVLVVAPTPQLAATLLEWLTEAGHEVILVTSFLAGKARLEHGPSVLISEVRLGDFNGLHLALRARTGEIPSIVVGSPDPVLEREAERLGVAYLTHELLSRPDFLSTLQRVVYPVDTGRTPRPASSTLSFVSWDELVPAVRDREESQSPRTRRTLRS
jgi:CheY-like chemotaxis protein